MNLLNMHLKRFGILLVSLAFFASAEAQYQFERDQDIAVFQETELLNPWVGGFTAPQFSRIDVDYDGDKDLFVFDRDGNRTLVFTNEDSSDGAINYRFAPEYASLFPELVDWVLLRDYDCDGKKDIFTSFQSSVKVYRNTGNEQDGLSFELTSGQVQCEFDFGGGPETFPLLVLSIDLPSITDYDGDGDLDIVTFTESATTLYFFEGQGADNGDCSDLSFKCTNRCYGMAAESAEDNSWLIGDEFVCPFNVVDPRSSDERGYRHTGGSIVSFDFDDNGILDLAIGDVTFKELAGLYMVDAVDGQDSTTLVDANFPGSLDDLPVELQRFPAGFYEDINNDGVSDLIVAPNTRIETNDDESIWLYLNEGTESNPEFVFQETNFLQNTCIEVGRGAYPTFFDHNGDGLQDLVLANKEYYELVDLLPSQLALFENTGSATAPEFTLIDDNWLDIPSLQVESIYPSFGDMDGDGDDDMILGEETGIIHFFRNVAEAGQPADMQLEIAAIADSNGETIDVGQFATPFIVDVDEDGLLDVLIGEKLGVISWYKNTGTVNSFGLTLQTGDDPESFGGVYADNFLGINGYSVPQLIKDGNGEFQLFMANELGTIQHFDGISGNLSGLFSEVDESVENIQEGSRAGSWVIDINNDGLLDVFYGIQNGGLIFYRGSDPDTVEELKQVQAKVYPVPGNDRVSFEFSQVVDGILEIYNLSGQIVEQVVMNQTRRTILNTSPLASGLYIYRVVGVKDLSGRLVIQH